jgi:hypothetical protein
VTRRLLVGLVAALALAGGGCGLGAGDEVGGVTLLVTRDFGRTAEPGSGLTVDAPGGETAMRATQRSFDVKTRYGGGFVQSIDGLAGGGRSDWFYYVNGVDRQKGAASVKLHRGDVVWWDHHDWTGTLSVPAVVGAFPEPFHHGIDGKRLPVRLECAPDADAACRAVSDRLGAVGVLPGRAVLNTRGGQELLRVLVGLWPAVRADFAAELIERGPKASGVFARPSLDGTRLTLLDARGRATRTLGPGTGLIAATATEGLPPTWIVTGTDEAGLELAARNLTSDALNRKFAVALADDLPIALPEVAGR